MHKCNILIQRASALKFGAGTALPTRHYQWPVGKNIQHGPVLKVREMKSRVAGSSPTLTTELELFLSRSQFKLVNTVPNWSAFCHYYMIVCLNTHARNLASCSFVPGLLLHV